MKSLLRQWTSTAVVSTLTALRSSVKFQCQSNLPLNVIVYRSNIRSFFKELFREGGNARATWLVLIRENTPAQELFYDVNIPFNYEFLVARLEGELVTLTEIYRVSPTSPLQTFYFGNWTLSAGLRCTEVPFYRRRSSLDGHVFRGAIQRNRTISMKSSVTNKARFGVFVSYLWNTLTSRMNATTVYYKSVDNSYGVRLENGSWNGMMGMIQKGVADFIGTEITMDSLRMNVTNFMDPLYKLRSVMYIKNPDQITVEWDSFLKPFSIGFWLTWLGIMVLLQCSLAIAIVIGRKYLRKDLYHRTTVFDAFYSILTSFCNQGQDESLLNFMSMRVVFVTSYLTAVVIFSGYSSSLISFLTVRTTTLPFHNYEEFLEDGTYRVGVLSNSMHYTFFKESSDPYIKQIYERDILPYAKMHPKSFLEGLERVCAVKDYAFMAPVTSANRLMDQLNCRIMAIPDAVIPGDATIAIDKKNPFQRLLSYYLQVIRQSGILRLLRRRFVQDDVQSAEVENNSADMGEVKAIFLILAIGTALSVLIMLIEKFIRHRPTRNNSHCQSEDVSFEFTM